MVKVRENAGERRSWTRKNCWRAFPGPHRRIFRGNASCHPTAVTLQFNSVVVTHLNEYRIITDDWMYYCLFDLITVLHGFHFCTVNGTSGLRWAPPAYSEAPNFFRVTGPQIYTLTTACEISTKSTRKFWGSGYPPIATVSWLSRGDKLVVCFERQDKSAIAHRETCRNYVFHNSRLLFFIWMQVPFLPLPPFCLLQFIFLAFLCPFPARSGPLKIHLRILQERCKLAQRVLVHSPGRKRHFVFGLKWLPLSNNSFEFASKRG